jgi:hypothetical protein
LRGVFGVIIGGYVLGVCVLQHVSLALASVVWLEITSWLPYFCQSTFSVDRGHKHRSRETLEDRLEQANGTSTLLVSIVYDTCIEASLARAK